MLLKNRKKRLCCFTLLELLVSMGVFAILMLALMQFFTSAQSIWTRSNTRYDMYDNARLALNLMATDLQCLYYDDDKTNAKYFDVSGNDDKWTLSLATQRSDSSSACTSLVLVYYQYDKAEGTLKFKQVTDYDADNNNKQWITSDSGSGALSACQDLGTELDKSPVLAENIVNFPVPTCQYLPQAGAKKYVIDTPDAPPNNIPIPQRVILSMTLIDSDTRKKLTPILASHEKDFKDVHGIAIKKEEDLKDWEKPIADLAKQSIQTFVQAVSIDR